MEAPNTSVLSFSPRGPIYVWGLRKIQKLTARRDCCCSAFTHKMLSAPRPQFGPSGPDGGTYMYGCCAHAARSASCDIAVAARISRGGQRPPAFTAETNNLRRTRSWSATLYLFRCLRFFCFVWNCATNYAKQDVTAVALQSPVSLVTDVHKNNVKTPTRWCKLPRSLGRKTVCDRQKKRPLPS